MNQKAVLRLTGWHGYDEQPVIVVGETPKKYRIKTVGSETVQLGGKGNYLRPGELKLVPKHAIRFIVDEPERNKYRNYGEPG